MAGRIEEALAVVIALNRLPVMCVVLLPLAIASRLTAEELLRTTKAAILIGRMMLGASRSISKWRMRKMQAQPHSADRAWERSVSSPSELTPVINTAAP